VIHRHLLCGHLNEVLSFSSAAAGSAQAILGSWQRAWTGAWKTSLDAAAWKKL